MKEMTLEEFKEACAARKAERLAEIKRIKEEKAKLKKARKQLRLDKAEILRMKRNAERALMLAGVPKDEREGLIHTPKITESTRQRMRREALTQERLHELLKYEPDTGKLFRIASSNGKVYEEPREIKNHARSDGYTSLMVEGVRSYVHRVIFFYVIGRWPQEIDHINQDKRDNRWENLREVTRTENCNNRNPKFKGLSFEERNLL